MCHGLIEERAAVAVPDFLRSQCYQVGPEYEKTEDRGEFSLHVYGQESGVFSMIDESRVQREASSLSEGALTEIVENYSSAVKKFDSEEVDDIEVGALASTGSLSSWFDGMKDTFDSATVVVKSSPRDAHEDTAHETVRDVSDAGEKAPKSRKARKSAAKEQIRAQHDSEMEDGSPVLIDEKKKRRMSSNRASAQRSRQRKQERLDELEILTAQLRLETANLAHKLRMAEQLAKRTEMERNALAEQVEELRKELEVKRQPRTQGSSASGDESDTCINLSSGVSDMVEGGGTSPDACMDAQTPSKGNLPAKRTISSTDLSSSLFQELYDAFESEPFDVSLIPVVSDPLQEEWYGSFTDCLNV